MNINEIKQALTEKRKELTEYRNLGDGMPNLRRIEQLKRSIASLSADKTLPMQSELETLEAQQRAYMSYDAEKENELFRAVRDLESDLYELNKAEATK